MRLPRVFTWLLPLAPLTIGGCDYDQKVGGFPRPTPPAESDTISVLDVAPDTSTTSPDTTTTTTPDTASAPDTEPAGPDTTPPPEWTHPEVIGVEVDKGEDTPLDPLTPAPEPRARGRARLDIDQIDMAFQVALSGITWTRRVGNTDVNQFKALSETLGVPDFLDTTVEDLGATTLFAKFLGDAARKACADRTAADRTLAETGGVARPVLAGEVPLTATLATHEDLVERQIAALLLRFHGQTITPDAPEFAPWRWLFESTTQLTGDPAVAWRALCVALITHPDFYTY